VPSHESNTRQNAFADRREEASCNLHPYWAEDTLLPCFFAAVCGNFLVWCPEHQLTSLRVRLGAFCKPFRSAVLHLLAVYFKFTWSLYPSAAKIKVKDAYAPLGITRH
jgi:hypothetical protein